MARFYTNENIPSQVVTELPRLGHNVATSLDAGMAISAVPDAEVLALAVADGRILLDPQSPPQSPPLSSPSSTPDPATQVSSCAHSTPVFAGRRSALTTPSRP